MYLSKKTYIYQDDRKKVKISGVNPEVNGHNVKYIVEDAGYWRKANAIHRWFVENVQDGYDDCREYYVSPEKLQELLDIVTTVLKSVKTAKGKITNGYRMGAGGKAEPILEDGIIITNPEVPIRLLPTVEGFFFGGTDYDKYYIDDLKYTKKILTAALKDKHGEYYYESSW